jgi:hypothetical protein
VDLLIETASGIVPIEVKASATARPEFGQAPGAAATIPSC